MVDRPRSFLLTVLLLQRVRGGRINEVKRRVQELNWRLKRGGGLFSGGYGT